MSALKNTKVDDLNAGSTEVYLKTSSLGILTVPIDTHDSVEHFNPDFLGFDASISQRVNLALSREFEKTTSGRFAKRWAGLRKAQELLPGERVGICHKRLGFGSTGVELVAYDGNAGFRGLAKCGSVWACPVCASRIAVSNREKVQRAIEAHKESGGSVVMVTLTMRHFVSESFDFLLSSFLSAVHTFKQSRAWRRLSGVGSVSALEVTYGENGWHPHQHILLFLEEMALPEYFVLELMVQNVLEKAWSSALTKHGRECLENIGLKVSEEREAAKYVSKWGMDCEMTHAVEKSADVGSLTPWNLLLGASVVEDQEIRERCGRLFREFYASIYRRKQLTWTKGLKKKLGISGQDDDQEVEVLEIEFSARISFPAWRVIWAYGFIVDLHRAACDTRYDDVLAIVEKAELQARCLRERNQWIGWNGVIFERIV